jgi:hypothetical protein
MAVTHVAAAAQAAAAAAAHLPHKSVAHRYLSKLHGGRCVRVNVDLQTHAHTSTNIVDISIKVTLCMQLAYVSCWSLVEVDAADVDAAEGEKSELHGRVSALCTSRIAAG